MRAYIAHNMDENEELQVGLETARSEATAAWNLVEEGACLLRKVGDDKEASHTEARWLDEEKTTITVKKEKTEDETIWLRRELQDLRAGFVTQKKDLETDYQKQVNDMFLYDYQYCMKKHDIANDALNFPFDDEDDEYFGQPYRKRWVSSRRLTFQ